MAFAAFGFTFLPKLCETQVLQVIYYIKYLNLNLDILRLSLEIKCYTMDVFFRKVLIPTMNEVHENPEKYHDHFPDGPGTQKDEDKWRHRMPEQRQRNVAMISATQEEKINAIKWIKKFNEDFLGYIHFSQGRYEDPLPKNKNEHDIIVGYIVDISECKRTYNEEDINVGWNDRPYLIEEELWA
jgi:hypothetical protein